MNNILTPQQLPSASAQFIAYGAPERAANPAGGDPITVRPQVYVRYYHEILIKSLQDGGADGDKDDLVTVNFDPKSIGLAKPIKAHMDSDDPTVAILREKHAAGQPVAVAIETQRKRKSSDTKEAISPLVPIHALRGADSPDGGGHHERMMGPSGANTTNRLAMVNGRATKHLISDPMEWAVLVNNKAGDLPPEGWRYFAPGEDWKEVGTIVPSENQQSRNASQGQGGGAPAALDMSALRDMLTDVMNDVLDAREQGAEQVPGRPTSRKFSEGKPWDVRTSDGRINLGGYAVSGETYTFFWAHKHLVEAATTEETPEPHVATEDAWNLVSLVMGMADQVRSQAYAAIVEGGNGSPVDNDRTGTSHKDAVKWVKWAIDNGNPLPTFSDDEGQEHDEDAEAEAMQRWTSLVIAEAVEGLATAGKRVGHYLAEKSRVERERRQAAPPAKPQQDEGPNATMVQAILDTVVRSWDSQQVIGNLGKEIKERGWNDLIVSMSTGEDGKPSISFPAKEGETQGAVRQLLAHRWNELKGQAGDGPAPESAPEPQSAPAQPEQAPQAQQDAAPVQDAQGDPNRGYSPQVAEAVRRIYNCGDMDTLKAIYHELREQNLLASTVSVNPRPSGGFDFGANGEPGFAKRALSDVLNALRVQFSESDAVSDAPAPEAQPEQHPETSEAQPEQEEVTEAAEGQEAEAEDVQSEPETPEPTETEEASAEEAPAQSEPAQSQEASPELDLAHDIARRGGEAKSTGEIEALMQEAQDAGVYESMITMQTTAAAKPRQGALRSWLKTLHRRLEQAGATSNA